MVQIRKDALENGNIYHVYSRSISKYVVFNDAEEFKRICDLINLFRYSSFTYKYSRFIELDPLLRVSIVNKLKTEENYLVEIIAYCLMPTHIHLILKQVSDNGISKYMSRVLNGYSRYFNTKHKRIGPLWSGRFKSVLTLSDEQLIHLTRYVHLNPTSAGLVSNPISWGYSSFGEYIGNKKQNDVLCNFKNLIAMDPKEYNKFVNNQKDYQKRLSLIKYLMIDDYSG